MLLLRWAHGSMGSSGATERGAAAWDAGAARLLLTRRARHPAARLSCDAALRLLR
jgi:hypothetical protein